MPAGQFPPPGAGTPAGPAQERLAAACAEADRLSALAEQSALRLRDARRARAAFERQSEQSTALADPHRLADAKNTAHEMFREKLDRARDRAAVVAGTAEYLREVDRLNRAARAVAGQADTWAAHRRALDEQVNTLAMKAEAARVSAAAARQACLDARRALAHEDEARAGTVAAQPLASPAARPAESRERTPIEALLAGDRDALRALVPRLAEEVGLDAGRLQLLLLELREAIYEGALAAAALEFPSTSRFWTQFSRTDARALAAALGSLGRGFDGRHGWREGRPAESRELAMAISMAGRDARTLRVRPTGTDLDILWQGVTIDAIGFLRERSPDLALETLEPLTGARAEQLTELWNNWGRLRRLLLSPAPAPAQPGG